MAVTLTEAAARHVNRYLGKRGKGLGVRLGVKTTGCSGLAYKLEYVDELSPEDVVFEDHGVKVLVDPKSLAYIDGNHHLRPTMRYFEMVRDSMRAGVVIFDDIRWSDEMVEAWSEIVGQHSQTIDLGWIGLAAIEG